MISENGPAALAPCRCRMAASRAMVDITGHFRLMITPSLGPRPWFMKQCNAIRATGAGFDETAQVWIRWVDPADPQRLATALTEMAAVVRDFGATLTVTPAAAVLDGSEP